MAAFEELGTCPELIRAVSEMGWLLPTPVQAEAVGLILGGGDVAAAAETGSGKTGAFGLPILQVCHEVLQQRAAAEASKGALDKSAAAAADARTARAAQLQQQQPLRVNTDDREAQLAVDGTGLICQSRAERQWQGARAERGVRSGAHYFEVTVRDEGLVRVGWSQLAAKLELGTDAFGYGYGGTAKKSNNRQFDSYGELYGKGDVIGCYLDLGAGEISFSKNGKHLGKAFSLPSRMKNGRGGGWFPAITMKNAEVMLNFGDDPDNVPLRFPPTKPFAPVGNASADVTVSGDETESGMSRCNDKGGPVAVILEPARELAEQVCDEIAKFKQYLSAPTLSHGLFVGGVDVRDNIRTLAAGCHIVVGTPGRVLDLVESGKMKLQDVQFFVLDEADRLLDTGNQQSITKLHTKIKKFCAQAVMPDGYTGRPLQTLLFSATLHDPIIQQLSQAIQRFPTWVDLKGKDAVPETVHHVLVRVNPRKDSRWKKQDTRIKTDGVHHSNFNPNKANEESLSEGIKRLKPLLMVELIEQHQMDQAIVFVRTQLDCDNLEHFLLSYGGGRKYTGKAEKGKENPFSCVVLHGGRQHAERKRNLAAFKDGDVRFLVCTDVAARGLDIAGLPYCINLTLPDKPEDYIHRIGRVGRADTMGLAISLVATEKEKVWFYDKRKWANKPLSTALAKVGKAGNPEGGGCCIWYDEPRLLTAIEKRMAGGGKQGKDDRDGNLPIPKIEELGNGYALPEGMAAAVYGESRENEGSEETGHVEQLRGAVEELRVLETQATVSFYTLQNLFGGAAVAGGPSAKPLSRPGETHIKTQSSLTRGGTGRGGGSRGRGISNHRGGGGRSGGKK